MGEFDRLHEELKSYFDSAQITPIENAYLLAKKAHEGQLRYTGESYITHPLSVALILAQMRMDPQTIMEALDGFAAYLAEVELPVAQSIAKHAIAYVQMRMKESKQK